MSRRKRLHKKLYGRVDKDGKVFYVWPAERVVGRGTWLGGGGKVGTVVTLPCKRAS